MKLLTLNVEDKNFISLTKSMTDGKGDEVLFVNWVPLLRPETHTKEGNRKIPIKNIDIIQSTPKDVRLVIFDRYSSLTKSEVDIYLKRDAILLEPVLRPRPGFLFMPYWLDKIDLPLSTWEEKRPFHTGVKAGLLHTDAYVTMVNYSRKIENLKIGLSTNSIPKDRFEVFKGVAEFGDFSWNKFRTTFIVGTDTEHRYGVLPDIRSHLKYGVIPIVSHNHKWFHALFRNFIEFDTSTMVWYHKMCEKISGYGFMDELYKNINNYMPEMFTKNFIQTLTSLCKK